MARAAFTGERSRSAIHQAIAAKDWEALGDALSPRQRLFCNEYVVDFEGKAAAIRAGYAITYAEKQASNLLRKTPGIAEYIDYLSMSKTAKITAVTPDYVIQGVVGIINKDTAKDSDKLRGFELLARHLGMLTDRTEITGKDGRAIELREVSEEADKFAAALALLAERAEKKEVTLV